MTLLFLTALVSCIVGLGISRFLAKRHRAFREHRGIVWAAAAIVAFGPVLAILGVLSTLLSIAVAVAVLAVAYFAIKAKVGAGRSRSHVA